MSCSVRVWSLAFAAASGLTIACAGGADRDAATGPRAPLDAAASARAEHLFLASCAGYCHTPIGGGRGDAPDLFDCVWVYGDTDAAIFRSISEAFPQSESDMPAFRDTLSASEIWLLVDWLRTNSRCTPPEVFAP